MVVNIYYILYSKIIMKTIKFFLLAAAFCLSFYANALETKKAVLGVEAVTYSSDFSKEEAETIRNLIINAVQNTGRVIVADHNSTTDSALKAESERRKQESAMDANTVADMVSLNANSLMTIHLDHLLVTKEIYEDTEYVKVGDKTEKRVKGRYPYLKATLAYTVKITDCANGAVQFQETFTASDGSYSIYNNAPTYSDPDAARAGVIRKSVNEDSFKLIILNTFRAQGKILQVDKGDAKKAKTVYVSLGSEDGVEAKQILEVYNEIDIAGEVSRKLCGELEVEEVLGASRCLAKVKKGGDTIQQVLAIGGNLPVQTREVKQKFFGGVK